MPLGLDTCGASGFGRIGDSPETVRAADRAKRQNAQSRPANPPRDVGQNHKRELTRRLARMQAGRSAAAARIRTSWLCSAALPCCASAGLSLSAGSTPGSDRAVHATIFSFNNGSLYVVLARSDSACSALRRSRKAPNCTQYALLSPGAWLWLPAARAGAGLIAAVRWSSGAICRADCGRGELRCRRGVIGVAGCADAEIVPAVFPRRVGDRRVDAELAEALLQPVGIERAFISTELDPIARHGRSDIGRGGARRDLRQALRFAVGRRRRVRDLSLR